MSTTEKVMRALDKAGAPDMSFRTVTKLVDALAVEFPQMEKPERAKYTSWSKADVMELRRLEAEGFGPAEIADQMGKPRRAVESKLMRDRKSR